MKNKTSVATALLATGLAAASAAAWAENLSQPVPLETFTDDTWSAFATAAHGEAGPFVDTFFFAAFPHPVLVDGNLSTTNLGTPVSSIDFSSAALSNGITTVHYNFVTTTWTLLGSTFIFRSGAIDAPTVFEANLPLTLTVAGVAASGYQPAMGNVAASYNSNVNFAAASVPEPSTVGMLFAGLAVVGWLTKRRQG